MRHTQHQRLLISVKPDHMLWRKYNNDSRLAHSECLLTGSFSLCIGDNHGVVVRWIRGQEGSKVMSE